MYNFLLQKNFRLFDGGKFSDTHINYPAKSIAGACFFSSVQSRFFFILSRFFFAVNVFIIACPVDRESRIGIRRVGSSLDW